MRALFAAMVLVAGSVGSASAARYSKNVGAPSATMDFDRAVADAKATMLSSPDTARRKAGLAERLARELPDGPDHGVAVATAQWLQGEALVRMNAISAANVPIEKALATITKLSAHSKLHADILLSRGGIETGEGRAANALRDYQAAFAIYRELNDTRGEAMALISLASLYSDAMDQPTSLRYSQQALDVYRSDPNLAISIYNNRGVSYREIGDFKKAEEQFSFANARAKELNSPLISASVLNNMARVKLSKGDLKAADRAIAQGLPLSGGQGASNVRTQLLATAAQAALQAGSSSKARKWIGEAFAGVDPMATDLSLRDSHQTAYDVFKAAGDDKGALVHLQAMKRLDDNATKLATSTSTALMAARFDFANQELRITQLKADELERSIAFERAQAQTQHYVFLGAAAAVAVIIGMLTFALVTARRSSNQVRAANDDLAVTNSALGKALAAKTEFLATTSHEIRTPLNGILGMTQVMLADPKLAPDLRDRLGVVHGAGVTMRALVDDILDVAKMETGNLTIEAAPYDLCATVTDATRMWEDQARAKGLRFDIDLSACPAMIMGDAARVRQIVFNLLSNALKFTKAGRVALSVRADGDRLRVDVADSGIGIPADKLEEIFESFRQADAGTTRQFGGTGLGLSICRNLARAMGGDVGVTSKPGEGATFSLMLPLVHAAAVEAAQPRPEIGAALLVVDRNPITRSMFKTLFAPHHPAVVCVSSIDEAVSRLGEGGVANVLIDDATVRGDGDAPAALRAIVAVAGNAATTLLWPVSAEVERRELLDSGITRVVAKPVSGAALIAAIAGHSVSKNNANLDLVSQAA